MQYIYTMDVDQLHTNVFSKVNIVLGHTCIFRPGLLEGVKYYGSRHLIGKCVHVQVLYAYMLTFVCMCIVHIHKCVYIWMLQNCISRVLYMKSENFPKTSSTQKFTCSSHFRVNSSIQQLFSEDYIIVTYFCQSVTFTAMAHAESSSHIMIQRHLHILILGKKKKKILCSDDDLYNTNWVRLSPFLYARF